MGTATITCPRCFAPVAGRAKVRFCPRCGMAGVLAAASDTSPMELAVGRRAYRVLDRIAVGSVCSLYRCRFVAGGAEVEGVFKIARDARTNDLVANEASALRRLHAADAAGRFMPFLPIVEETLGVGGDAGTPPRQANVLRVHREIRSAADELYTLAEVRAQYPAGLDARDVAWIWRRLLSVLGFAHAQGVTHAAVLPMHVLVEPREHKLLLVDWCCASHDGRPGPRPPGVIGGGYEQWYKREGGLRRPPTPPLDVALGARCMIDLLGGDPAAAAFPPAVDPALVRYFQRCLGADAALRPDAWKLLDDFDHLIRALWGPRTFRVFTMPAKGTARA